jgi:Ca2+-binding EF-hand superfamily protein
MTNRLAKLITTAAVLTAAGAARANGDFEHAGQGGGTSSAGADTRTALFLAHAADADGSGDVTAAEWDAFKASLDPDGNGVIDLRALIAALPLPVVEKHGHDDDGNDQGDDEDENDDDNANAGDSGGLAGLFTRVFDHDGDGTIETSDLDAFFALIDTNGDGSLSAAEIDAAAQSLAPPPVLEPDPHKAALLLARAADADKSGDVTATEWADFKASLHPDANGVIDIDALIAALPRPVPQKHGSIGDDGNSGGLAEFFIRVYDHDGDGNVETSDLDAFFAMLDTNGDGALSADELPTPVMTLRRVPERALRLLARAVDADRKHGITAAEVTAFTDGLVAYPASGAVDLGDLATKLRWPAAGSVGPARRKALLIKMFDLDRNGVVTLSDLQTILGALDINGDGTIEKRELLRARRLRR